MEVLKQSALSSTASDWQYGNIMADALCAFTGKYVSEGTAESKASEKVRRELNAAWTFRNGEAQTSSLGHS